MVLGTGVAAVAVAAAPERLEDLEAVSAIALSGVEARGAALLMTGQSGGDVAGTLLWTAAPGPSADGVTTIPFVVEVDGAALLEPPGSGRIPLEFYGYLVDEDGSVVEHLADGVFLDHDLHGRNLRRIGLRFAGVFKIEAGVYSFRVLLRNRQNGRYFLVREDLEVPVAGGGEPFLLPPMAAAPDVPWFVAAQHGSDPNTLRQAFPGHDSWPTGRPVWPTQQPLEIVLGSSALDAGWSLSSRLINPAGREVDEPELVICDRVNSSAMAVFHRATIDAPDVPEGEYRLVVRLADSESGRSVTRSLRVIIQGGSSPMAWTDPAVPRGPPPRSPPAITEEPSRETLKRELLRTEYLAALGHLATGDAAEARRALARLERRVREAHSGQSWTKLKSTERRTARRLAERRPESLLATILLHRDMYTWYGARYESALAEHSWALTVALVEDAARFSSWQAPEGFVEAVLLDLASDLITAAHARTAQHLMETALRLAPEQPQALLGLGAVHERAGEPDLAARYLEELLAMQSDHHEARLRLAVNTERMGKSKEAEVLFQELLARSTPSWIDILAFQELSRIKVASKHYDEAGRLLLRAVERHPHNQRLRILLAYVFDRAGRPGEATSVIEQFEAEAGQRSTSPRARYGAWPVLLPARLQDALAEGQRLGVEALQEVLP
jgi:tetratricopeptide (TPR) repeat protein